jgi:hypothetical protein
VRAGTSYLELPWVEPDEVEVVDEGVGFTTVVGVPTFTPVPELGAVGDSPPETG